jgi:adenylate kinase family enzyme
MRRIVILGCSGTGKSTLARRLGRRLGLPVIHLDQLYWRPGWQKPDPEEFRSRVAAAVAGDAWITDGNYSATFDLRLPRADAVIILERARWRPLCRVLRRRIIERRTRPDLPEGCPERFDWELLRYIWRFDRDVWPRIEAALVAGGLDLPVVRLRAEREIAAFIAGLTAQPASPAA